MSTILIILLAIVFSFARGYLRLAFKMSKYDYAKKDMPDALIERNSLKTMLRAWIRRRNILRIRQRFVYIDKNIITLRNRNVSVVLDTKNKTINCVDNRNKHKFATVIWENQPFSAFEKFDNSFERVFDNICYSFSDYANYSGILAYLKQNFIVEENETKSKTMLVKKVKEETKFQKENKNPININTANEKELSKLPGISIVVAKKIIKYRDVHGGFNSRGEFYQFVKMKPHFQSQIDSSIIVNSDDKKRDEDDNRVVDF